MAQKQLASDDIFQSLVHALARRMQKQLIISFYR